MLYANREGTDQPERRIFGIEQFSRTSQHDKKQEKTTICYIRTAKALIRLRICAIWSGLSLFADVLNRIKWICSQPVLILIELSFYGPVNSLVSCRARSVYLATLYRLFKSCKPLTSTCTVFLDSGEEMNDRRKHFMINLHERMLPETAGIEPKTSWSSVGRASDLAIEAGSQPVLSKHLGKSQKSDW